MKKADFYNDVRTNIEFLTGANDVNRGEWYKVGGSIILVNDYYSIGVKCNRNVVTVFTKRFGEKGKTDVTDYNNYYSENMAILTAEKIDKFLTI